MNERTNPKILDEILAVLKTARHFCLAGHQNPDADVIGSALALKSLIKRMNSSAKIDIFAKGGVPPYLSFLTGIDSIKSVDRVDGVYDAVIVFECSGADRMGNIVDFKTQAQKVINIDHHLHNPNFGDINWVEPTTSSTSELIFKIFERSGLPITKDEAICMFTGMVTDTGWFRFGNTNSQTHRIASALLDAGVPVAHLSESIYMSRSKPALQVQSRVLLNMKLHFGDKLAVLKLPTALLNELGATSDDIEDLVNCGLQMKCTKASVLIKEGKGGSEVKASLRSKGDLDINQVARKFGGGGHKNASGCTLLNTNIEEAERLLLSELEKII